MHAFPTARRAALVATIVLAGTSLALPVFAASPTAVTFKAHNPWTQEIGSIDNYHPSDDYTVTVKPGKTLQINLVTRDPNVFFKVANQTQDKQLVDTYKTGATTWSTPVKAPSTYKIHVYADPYAMQRGEVAKYALQVGRYGAKDMQVATTKVTFAAGKPWAQEASSLNSKATSHNYTVAIAAGKTLKLNLITRNSHLHFKVKDKAQGQLVDTARTGKSSWSTHASTNTTYTIHVYADAAALPPGKHANYALQIGHYQTAATPASATSSSMPAASASTAPAASSSR